MDRHEAECQEQDKKNNREVLYLAIVKFWLQFNHGDLPGETHKPEESEDQGNSVQLMMNQLIVLVDLKDKCIVNVVAAEDLNGKAC